MSRRVEFSPEALGDLLDLYGYIAQRDGTSRAIGYIRRIEKTCHSLSTFPERGKRRDDIRPGLRVLGFEKCRNRNQHLYRFGDDFTGSVRRPKSRGLACRSWKFLLKRKAAARPLRAFVAVLSRHAQRD